MPEVHATPAIGKRDRRKLVKTTTPGIYKRVKSDGSTADYAVIYRAGGKQRREYARTLDAARKLKRERETDRDRGEFQERTTIAFRAFLTDWIDNYQGNGRTTFRENTREEYRRLLDLHAHTYFGPQLRLCDLTPKALNDWVRHLGKARDGKLLSSRTIRNIVAPVRSALADAKRQGLIRHNPATDLVIPKRTDDPDQDDDEQVNALSAEQLAALLLVVPPKYRLLVRFTAATGLRISEVAALQIKHLQLDGSTPHVQVRRAFVKGKIDAPKSKNGKRKVLLPSSLVDSLRSHVAGLADDDLVFRSRAETMIDSHNLRRRVLKTSAEEACVPLIGWHTLRHTYASLQLAAGANMLQLSKALGHATPAFTLSVYCHLLPGGEAAPLDVDALVPTEADVLAAV
jgi:integrase